MKKQMPKLAASAAMPTTAGVGKSYIREMGVRRLYLRVSQPITKSVKIYGYWILSQGSCGDDLTWFYD